MFIPTATYRLQFNRHFTFDQARKLIPYFDELGVGSCYASPLFKARPGSDHGYDVVDHQTLNQELGSETDFFRFANGLKRHNIGLLFDVVPNHMCISDAANQWWNDVLENGPSSPFSACFDVDWRPPKAELLNKILLPELSDQFGRELENKNIQISYENGVFQARTTSSKYPIAPRSWSLILDMMLKSAKDNLSDTDAHFIELQSIRTSINYLPLRTETDPDKVSERYREKEIIRKRLINVLDASPPLRKILESALLELNGEKGQPQSFDRLELLLEDQVYRLCHWKVAADEINYRRFFDINHLAAIRVEVPAVFGAVHGLVFKLIGQGLATGLRIDHLDGLLDPVQYIHDLQENNFLASTHGNAEKTNDGTTCQGFYVIVEKILLNNERLNSDWKVQGTTGYDFMNLLNGIFVETANKQRFLDLYSRFSGLTRNITDVIATCKKLVLHVSMASELHVLSSQLDRISEQHRWSRDFTLESLRFALREVIAYFPTYRSYIRQETQIVTPEDTHFITAAIQEAKNNNPSTSESVFDFIQDVLLLKDPPGISENQTLERRKFVLRFQQLTSPVMAKGIEDTAFYRFFPLASLNEVGGGPEPFGVSLDHFHNENKERLKQWPNTLLATTTHDTKRSEDVRARINVLSEIPTKWYRTILHWQALNKNKKKIINGYPTPDANEEYLLYQTLLGSWPVMPMDLTSHHQYQERITQYMIKAVKEAKLHTSWINPNQEYEEGLAHFISGILELSPDNEFLKDFMNFQKPIAEAGLRNSLAQLVLKLTVPGIPDFYQGTELWNFSLVDPDNRQPVNFQHQMDVLKEIKKEMKNNRTNCVKKMMDNMEDGRIKLFTTFTGLEFRKKEMRLFQEGRYVPLKVKGPREDNVCAFARVLGNKVVITVTARFLFGLNLDQRIQIEGKTWEGSTLALNFDAPPNLFVNIFTGKSHQPTINGSELELVLADILNPMPVAILEGIYAR